MGELLKSSVILVNWQQLVAVSAIDLIQITNLLLYIT